MQISLSDLRSTAQESYDKATSAADSIRLSRDKVEAFSESIKYAAGRVKALRESMLEDKPEYSELPTYKGLKAWGALLSFDLRNSSALAREVSPRDMYVIMHTYLPTALAVIEGFEGAVVGLRGDGAIASFGLVDTSEGQPPVAPKQAEHAVERACDCGDAIVKAVKRVVNPVLAKGAIKRKDGKTVGVGEGVLEVGVGIDVGDIVATRIGLSGANELTAYGTAVNECCKLSTGRDEVILTHRAREMFPKEEGGLTSFTRHRTKNGFVLHYPPDYQTLA